MNPLDRSLTPPSPQQEAPQLEQSEQANSEIRRLMQGSITNVIVSGDAQPVSVPSAEGASFMPPPLQAAAGLAIVSGAIQTVETEESQRKAHKNLIKDIAIPKFTVRLTNSNLKPLNRQLINNYIKAVFIALKGKACFYNQADFIVEQLLKADANNVQDRNDLINIVEKYIHHKQVKYYLNIDWDAQWPEQETVKH